MCVNFLENFSERALFFCVSDFGRMDMKYNLEVGDIVYFKCKVVGIRDNCNVRVRGANCGEKNIEFCCHVNSLKKIEDDNETIEHDKFKCLRCGAVYFLEELTIELYGKNYSLERYCCPKCDGTCIDIENC